MNLKELISLMALKAVVSFHNLIEWVKIVFRYYFNSFDFFKADLALRLLYLFSSPYSISKKFLLHKGSKEIYAYGETPLTTMEKISKEAAIGPNDCVFELGAGRGLTCFWLKCFTGCSVVGIEYVPLFVDRANRIKNKLDLKRIRFCLSDMVHVDLSGATVVYLYGTCLEEAEISQLINKFKKLPSCTKIITVSFSLDEYDSSHSFLLMRRFSAPFTWGKADVYLQIVY